ncbi:FKBP-type peptidyl-prolyl cis-trans isomerase [Balneolales bacterium ANBcel1]|nr:FKBP-type peptidyl-prolyl cis-trans isomerase [Balneolales bacterium ANBcel1]
MLNQNASSSLLFITLALALTVALASCDDNNITSISYHDIGPFDLSGAERIETEEGLVIYEHQEGDGAQIAEEVHQVLIRYTGRTTDGEIFDSSYRNEFDSPRSMNVRRNDLIRGFFQGLVGVHVDGERKYYSREGTQRTLIIPPELGYGDSPGHWLGSDTLIFDFEIIEISFQD